MRVQLINGEVVEVANIIVTGDYGQESYILKDWNWNWRRDKLTYIPINAVAEILDDSGSDFRDGYELGLLHGANNKEEELISEGVLEEDPDYEYYDEDEEETNLDPLFEMYEGKNRQ